MKKFYICFLFFLFFLTIKGNSTNIKVPSQFSTIQEAINNAQNGDTILVADGVYYEEINFNGYAADSVIIKSESGPENCIVDCQNGSWSIGFLFNSEDCKSTIEGFTIRNATMGIFAYASSTPVIKNNIIENCEMGISCSSEALPVIHSNLIRNCGGLGEGGGIDLSWSSAIVSNNVIVNNFSSKGGGIYCYHCSPNIINNTIVGNSWIGTSSTSGEPTLRCEYDEYNRIYECFIPEAAKTVGGGIYLEDSSPDIINNLIAFSNKSQETTDPIGLSRWYYDDLFMRYNYESAKLESVTYYYGFKNNGETGEVHLYSQEKGGGSLDTTFTIQSGERYWMETTSFVSPSGDYGGLKLTAHIGTDSIKVSVIIDNPLFAGCYHLYDTKIQSHGISEDEQDGTGIIAIGENTIPNILYNDIYGNGMGNYIVGETSEDANVIDLTGVDCNNSFDPMLNEDFSLKIGSPCIDAGTPNTTGLGIGEVDFLGLPRIFDGDGDGTDVIDIGAFEMQSSTIQTEEYKSICQGEEYEGHTESETFQRTLTAASGADSIVTTYLTVNPTYEEDEYVSICEGEDYLGLTEEGDHQRQFETINGCDSIVITHLTVNPSYETEEYVSICDGDEYLGYSSEGDHSRELISVFGCDSIVVIHLSFYPSFKPTFSVNDDILTSNETYAEYQWCDENGGIAGATNQQYTIIASGDYYLMATNDNGCTYNSDTVFVRLTSSKELKKNKFDFSVLPNPNTGEFTFRIDSNPLKKLTLKLINTLGQVVEIRELENPAINQTEQFDVSHLSKGIYHLVIYYEDFKDDRKIVVN